MDELKGKVALITGASRGIGAATALEMAKLGVKTMLVARSTEALAMIAKEIREIGGECETFACDVKHYHEFNNAFEACLDRFGDFDILINNAGLIDPIARIEDSDPAQWCNVIDVNYKGVYHGIRAVTPYMKNKKSGVIVNVSSGAASSALEGWSHYCSSKAAALSLTQCADKEFRADGIRVVGLSPGTVATDMQLSIKKSGINPVSQLDPNAHIPASWAARAICWLCTENGDDYRGMDFSLKTEENKKKVGLII
ncbi:short-chain dehydrogenase [Kiloniella litopenaei]|uniref:Short-chain dehydrogenase n=1 Tax=Kiloniella litopenaei TaxID=1549748 RepID=A0A0M2R7T8_9PROT|nr:SDR family oxidoreductase [Kiloniella litopenaei]KKJ75593.1 short-chain dehydrogenase [Kiloniella litopenaei]